MIKQIIQIEATVFFIQLPAYGSICYERDLEPNCRRVKIPDRNGVKQLCIGLNTALSWWHDYRDLLPVDHVSNIAFTESQTLTFFAVERVEDTLVAGAKKELARMVQYARPRFPFERMYREFRNYNEADLTEHITSLKNCIQIAPFLIPKDHESHWPIIRHPDFSPSQHLCVWRLQNCWNDRLAALLHFTAVVAGWNSQVLPELW